jgi:hypothetical protein
MKWLGYVGLCPWLWLSLWVWVHYCCGYGCKWSLRLRLWSWLWSEVCSCRVVEHGFVARTAC